MRQPAYRFRRLPPEYPFARVSILSEHQVSQSSEHTRVMMEYAVCLGGLIQAAAGGGGRRGRSRGACYTASRDERGQIAARHAGS